MTTSVSPDADTRLNSGKPDPSTAKLAIPTRRLWIYRALTLLVIPALFLGCIELALSVAGTGYRTSYFLKSRIAGQDFLIPNYKFSYRFFPPTLARVPSVFRMPAEKAAGTFRIFVLGESAALGDPDPNYGIARQLDVLLEQRYPEAEFEVICVAMTAINSHVILPIAQEISRMDGDLWVIYMGNNEMVGPFGASTVFGPRAPGTALVRTGLALKKTRLGQWLASALSKLGPDSQPSGQWTGINMFKENLLRHDDPARLRTYKNFETNLRDIVAAGRQSGVPIILSTVGSNLKDCSPFASLHRKKLDAADKSEWDILFQQGLALEQTGQYEQALSLYREAAAIDSEYAELSFRMGTCQLALDRYEQARQSLARARDCDALAVRANTRINQIIMNSIPGHDNQVIGLDAAEALSAQSPSGVPGEELFYEHVHFTVKGNYKLARLIADQVKPFLPPEIAASRTESWLEQQACSRRLALTLWDQMRLWQEESRRINTPPFNSQTSNAHNKHYIHQQANRIRARITGNTWAQDNRYYVSALERNPEDTYLTANYAQFLDATGRSAQALRQAERFRDLLPDLAWTHYYLGALLAKAGRLAEAGESLEAALAIRSDFPQARQALQSIRGW